MLADGSCGSVEKLQSPPEEIVQYFERWFFTLVFRAKETRKRMDLTVHLYVPVCIEKENSAAQAVDFYDIP